MSSLEQAVVAVERGDAIGLSHGGVIEGGIDEILQRVMRRRLLHNRLTDMNDLGSVGAKAMDPEHC